MPSHNFLGDLHVEHVFDVPLREVSGICLRRGANHRMSLIAVGDRAAKVACLALPPEDFQSPPWQEIDLAGFAGSQLPQDDPQIEAICADGAGSVLLLQESPPRVELLDLETSKTVACMELAVEGNNDLAKSWSHPKGSRGEGVALLPPRGQGNRPRAPTRPRPSTQLTQTARDENEGRGRERGGCDVLRVLATLPTR